MTPNSEPTVKIPETWRHEAPELWAWIEANALYYTRDFASHVWNVWLPVGDGAEGANG